MHNDTHVRPHLTHSHTARVTIPQFATQPWLQPQHNKVVTLLLHHASTGAAVPLPMTDIGSEAQGTGEHGDIRDTGELTPDTESCSLYSLRKNI